MMKKKKRNILLVLSLTLVISLGFTTLANKDMELVKNLDIYYTLFRELNMFYVDETDPQDLVTTSIDADHVLTITGDPELKVKEVRGIKMGDKKEKVRK